MSDGLWLKQSSPAFRLMIATSWLAPDLWHDQQEQAIREAIGAGIDWAEYVRLVDRHRTPALSWAALKSMPGLDIPEPAKRELQQRSDACRMQAVGHALLLADVLKGFNGDGITGMPIKGPLLSLELYGDIGLRQSKDLDIMVVPQDVLRARACLEKLGWRPDEDYFPLSPRQWEALLRHEHHVGYVRPRGMCRMELHWRIYRDADDQTAYRWTRSVSSSWRGHSLQTMNSADLALYLCSHGSDHAWFRAKWLGDLARMRSKRLFDCEAVLEEAREANQERPLLLGLRLMNEAYGLPVPVASTGKVPSFLVDGAVRDLEAASGPDLFGPSRRFWWQIRKARYDRLLRPQTPWRKSLVVLSYCRQDFKELHLPDSLFWLYAPLRPLLWVWRRLLRGQRVAMSGK